MTRPLTLTQYEVLARMPVGEWCYGYEMTRHGVVLSALQRNKYIRPERKGRGYLDDHWMITNEGIAALERTA